MARVEYTCASYILETAMRARCPASLSFVSLFSHVSPWPLCVYVYDVYLYDAVLDHPRSHRMCVLPWFFFVFQQKREQTPLLDVYITCFCSIPCQFTSFIIYRYMNLMHRVQCLFMEYKHGSSPILHTYIMLPFYIHIALRNKNMPQQPVWLYSAFIE